MGIMYEKLVLFYTNMDGYDIYIPFYYRKTKKKSAKEKAEYDFFKIAFEVKTATGGFGFMFQSNQFWLTDFFYSGDVNDYNGPEFMTLDEYFEKTRLKMSEEEEKMLKRDIKISQMSDNQ